MNKKPINWVGWSVVTLFVIISGFISFFLGKHKVFYNQVGILVACTGCVFYLIFCGGMTIIIYKKTNLKIAFATSQEIISQAKVISKSFAVSGAYDFTGTSYFVSFEFPDNSRKNFSVNVNQYNILKEEETGLLTYKQYKNLVLFIDFKNQK